MLLSREEFRKQVFTRDKYCCVVCGKPAQDAHHILERRLFSDGGYYLDNGASVCRKCHTLAERTLISCDELRRYCGIKTVILPEHLYKDQPYDKWGNPMLPNGTRLRGELFNDKSVQKTLTAGGVLLYFSKHVKYPRTYHLPWSPGVGKDDRVLDSLETLADKMDGENTTLYNDYIHARSLTYSSHPSRTAVKRLHASIAHEIPEGWRICGENLTAKHSIHYKNLSDFFLVFSVWDENNLCLSWPETEVWASLLGLKTVPVLYSGKWSETIKDLYKNTVDGDDCEGYVVRRKEAFHYSQFKYLVAKYVRTNHVTSDNHWIHAPMVANELGDRRGG